MIRARRQTRAQLVGKVAAKIIQTGIAERLGCADNRGIARTYFGRKRSG